MTDLYDIDLYRYRFDVYNIVDGDTLMGDLQLGFHMTMNDTKLRLATIDTPERGHPWYGFARDTLANITPVGSSLLAMTIKPPAGMVTTTDNFGRYVADIFIGGSETGLTWVNEEMLAQPCAMVYDPKITRRWECRYVVDGHRCYKPHFDKDTMRCPEHGGSDDLYT